MNIIDIARYEASIAASEVRKIKEEAIALTASQAALRSSEGAKIKLRGLKQGGLWDKYQAAKGLTRLALTMVAIAKTYSEVTGQEELPNKGDFVKFLRERQNWRRLHAKKGKESATVMSAYRKLIKNQNRLKNGGSGFSWVSEWSNERSRQAAERSVHA